MMNKTDTHVIQALKGGWSVRRTGAGRAEKTFEAKADAIKYGRVVARARHTDLIIHQGDGRISGRTSYGSDPTAPRDRKK